MSRRVFVVGVGMTKFEKPGTCLSFYGFTPGNSDSSFNYEHERVACAPRTNMADLVAVAALPPSPRCSMPPPPWRTILAACPRPTFVLVACTSLLTRDPRFFYFFISVCQGRRDWDYPDMARIAAERALADACVDFRDIQQVACGYCYGDSTCGQRAVYQLGMTGVPVYNVNNNCATGSSRV